MKNSSYYDINDINDIEMVSEMVSEMARGSCWLDCRVHDIPKLVMTFTGLAVVKPWPAHRNRFGLPFAIKWVRIFQFASEL